MSGGAGRKFRGSRVVLNVYDLSPANSYVYDFGVGAFHSGVEIGGTEYTFGGHESSSSGIFTHAPKQAPNCQFRISIDMGETDKSNTDISSEIANLGNHFRGDSYHIVLQNCNHFSNELCLRTTGNNIPRWVNRLAGYGSMVSCLLPKKLGVAHPDSSDVTSQSTIGGMYRKSGAASYTPFAGQGLSLGQVQMGAVKGSVGEKGEQEERRALLARAAAARSKLLPSYRYQLTNITLRLSTYAAVRSGQD